MSPDEQKAFDWGKGFADLVRANRVNRAGLKSLTAKIREYTGLDAETSQKLCARVSSSDKNAYVFCMAKRPLTLEEIREAANAKNMLIYVQTLN